MLLLLFLGRGDGREVQWRKLEEDLLHLGRDFIKELIAAVFP
jgi:hypothetical protein